MKNYNIEALMNLQVAERFIELATVVQLAMAIVMHS